MIDFRLFALIVSAGASVACAAGFHIPDHIETKSGTVLYFSWPASPDMTELVRTKKAVSVVQYCVGLKISDFYPSKLQEGSLGTKERGASQWESETCANLKWLREQQVQIRFLLKKYADCEGDVLKLEGPFDSCVGKLGCADFAGEKSRLEGLLRDLEQVLERKSKRADEMKKKYDAWKVVELDRQKKAHLQRVQAVVTGCREQNEKYVSAQRGWLEQKTAALLVRKDMPCLVAADREIIQEEKTFLQREFKQGLESLFHVSLAKECLDESGMLKPTGGKLSFVIVPDVKLLQSLEEYATFREKGLADITGVKLSKEIWNEFLLLIGTAKVNLHVVMKNEFGVVVLERLEHVAIPKDLSAKSGNDHACTIQLGEVPAEVVAASFNILK